MIGVFDSGTGGLTVLQQLRRALPQHDFVYFGDTARYPYGSQDMAMLQLYAREDAAFLLRHGAEAIVIACNSASAAAGDLLRKELTVPVFDVITPPAELAVSLTGSNKVGVIGTRATIKSGAYEKAIKAAKPEAHVVSHATPMLVHLVQERWWKHPEAKRMIRRSLAPLKRAQVDTLILGCTHYPMIEKEISLVMGKQVTLINPAQVTAKRVAKEQKTNTGSGQVSFFVSGDIKSFRMVAEWWLGEKVVAEQEMPKSL